MSDSESFWVVAAATAYSLDALTAGPASSTPLGAFSDEDGARDAEGSPIAFVQAASPLPETPTEVGDVEVAALEEAPVDELDQVEATLSAGAATADKTAAAQGSSGGHGGGEAVLAADLENQSETTDGWLDGAGAGDVHWRQTEAIVAEGHAVAIVGVEGDAVFEGDADLIGLGGAAVKIEAEGSVSVVADASLAGRDAAIDATSTGDGDIAIEFQGSAAAGSAQASLDAALAALEAQLEVVEEALTDLHETSLDEPATAVAERGADASTENGLVVEADEGGEAISLAEVTIAVLDPDGGLSGGGEAYLRELAEAVDRAVETVVDSFEFAPEYVDGAIGQLSNASAVGVLANTGRGGVSVVADGVVLASGDAVSLSSEEGVVAAKIDGLLVGGSTAFSADGDAVRATLDGAAIGADTGVSVEATSVAHLDLEGVVRSGDGAAVRVSSEGDVELYVEGEVFSAGGVGVEIEAARDAKVRIDGVVEGGMALTGVTDGARLFGDGRYDVDVRGEISGGHAAHSGSAAAVSVDESFGANVRLTVVGDAWVEAGFVGLERDAAIRLGDGADVVEIEGTVIGDVLLGGGDDVVRIEKDGAVDGVINGGVGSDVFEAGDLAELFELTFGAGSDTVHGFGFGDRFDFSALAEYNADGAAAMLETHFWDEGQDVATLTFFDGLEEAELTIYGEELERMDFDDVFMWA